MPEDVFKREIGKQISKIIGRHIDIGEIEVPPSPEMGDYAFPCFLLAKELKKSPNEIAKDIGEKIKPEKDIESIKVLGPYVNFFVKKASLNEKVLKEILKKKMKYGSGNLKKEKIMVEYVSPNTNKSLHLGHVRNALLGNAVSNILQFQGYKVIKTSLNNDRGTGMSEAMLGYLLYHKNETPKMKPDHFVARCYVDYKKSETEETKDNVQELTLKWEKNNKEVRALWSKLTKWVYQGYKETYKALGIKFDKEYYESKIYKEGKDIVMSGLKKGIFQKKEEAIIAPLEKYGLPDKVLIKTDGTSLYMTQDLYLAKLKEKEFKVNRSIYVVASEQDLHFKQLFKILELLNFKVAKKSYHLSYGLVNLPLGRMKSREGTVVDADDVIEEVVDLARKEIKKRYNKMPKKELERRAEAIGIGALKFFMVKFDNTTSFTYYPEKSLSFEGETGSYVQYTYARICSILKKVKISNKIKFTLLDNEEEKAITMMLNEFPNVVEKAALDYKPNLISRFLLDLCQAFNEYYHKHKVLDEDRELKKARVLLCYCVREVIEIGLRLLSIEVVEEM